MKTRSKVITGITSLLVFCIILIGVFIWGYRTGRTHSAIIHAMDKGFDCWFVASGIRSGDTDRLLDFYEPMMYQCVNVMDDYQDYPLLSKRDRTTIDRTLTGIAVYFKKYPSEEPDTEYEVQDFTQEFMNDSNLVDIPKESLQELAEVFKRVSGEFEEDRKRAETVLERYQKHSDNE